MKKIMLLSFILLLSKAFLQAQSPSLLPVKLYAVAAIVGNETQSKKAVGKELSIFQVPNTANTVKLSIQVPVKDYKKYRLESLLRLFVLNTKTEEVILNSYWSTLYKDSLLITECFFPAGEYKISLVDNNAPTTPFAERVITVKPNETQTNLTINGFSYDTKKFKLWTCQSVDEVNWKPVGQLSRVKTGSCVTFFFESQEKIKNPGTMRWKLYKVEDDGKETFINQRDQTPRLEEWRRIYYEECDEFRSKGKYRMYFAIRNESEAYYGVRDQDYFAKADIIVD